MHSGARIIARSVVGLTMETDKYMAAAELIKTGG